MRELCSIVTTQRIHLLPQRVIIFILNRSHMAYTLPLCVRKCLDSRQNINTLSSYVRFIFFLAGAKAIFHAKIFLITHKAQPSHHDLMEFRLSNNCGSYL